MNTNTLFVGKVLHHLDRIDSTNTYAANLIRTHNTAEGTTILADYQTAGRGQMGSKWESEKKENIVMSVILYPKFLTPPMQFQLSVMAALAVGEVVQRILPNQQVKLKWPNDVLVENKKVAGILIQNVFQPTRIQSSIIGIGLNVHQKVFSTHLPNATSLAQWTTAALDRLDIVKDICLCMEQTYLRLKQGNYEDMLTDYYHQLYQFQELANYSDAEGNVFSGRIVGIDALGRLNIMVGQESQFYNLKAIKFL